MEKLNNMVRLNELQICCRDNHLCYRAQFQDYDQVAFFVNVTEVYQIARKGVENK